MIQYSMQLRLSKRLWIRRRINKMSEWGSLLSKLLENPEAKIAAKRVIQKSAAAAESEMTPLMKQIQRQRDIEQALNAPRSAAESAETLKNAPELPGQSTRQQDIEQAFQGMPKDYPPINPKSAEE